MAKQSLAQDESKIVLFPLTRERQSELAVLALDRARAALCRSEMLSRELRARLASRGLLAQTADGHERAVDPLEFSGMLGAKLAAMRPPESIVRAKENPPDNLVAFPAERCRERTIAHHLESFAASLDRLRSGCSALEEIANARSEAKHERTHLYDHH